MLTNTTKLDELIQRARQSPDKLSPVVLAKLNHHIQRTGGELIPLPWAADEPAVVQPDGNELELLKADYKAAMAHFTANPDQFTNEQHSRLYRTRALISMSEASRKL